MWSQKAIHFLTTEDAEIFHMFEKHCIGIHPENTSVYFWLHISTDGTGKRFC